MADKLLLKTAAVLMVGADTFPPETYDLQPPIQFEEDYDWASVLVLAPRVVEHLEKVAPAFLQERIDPFRAVLRLPQWGETSASVALLRFRNAVCAAVRLPAETSDADVLRTVATLRPPRITEEPAKPAEEHVRVLRVVEYTGPRSLIEDQVKRSVHGTRDFGNGAQITAVTLHEYPEVLEQAKPEQPSNREARLESALGLIADLDQSTRIRNVGRSESDRMSNVDTAMAIAHEALGLDIPTSAVAQSPVPSTAAAGAPDAEPRPAADTTDEF